MEFQDLLKARDISLNEVALALHKPGHPPTRNLLLSLAENERPLFELYQSTHAKRAEATARNRPYMAAFVAHGDGAAVFVGLYETSVKLENATETDLQAHGFEELTMKLNTVDPPVSETLERLTGRAIFHTTHQEAFEALSGRLIVVLPPGRNYMRRAETTPLPVIEITRMSRFAPPMPAWNELRLDAADLKGMPTDWAATLLAWRGIYLIVDRSDGARYVGAAYGERNLLGRWTAHVSSETGVTSELRRRKTSNFTFSILELVAPTADQEDVIRLERNWMNRLATIKYGLNT